ncbi:hypothetical protein E8E13_007912 [Curvularia kusanoi]|uniref:Uncharacterized protein n=1 Tax=Curvularia kusanoi TaxID=90978 RepID=A0A9P4TBV1_CURKU|nr:hypothetical protein E8E13_007912 [Curvularia kusanoi]
MAPDSQAKHTTAALDEIKDAITKFSDEFENLKRENEQLKDQVAHHKRKCDENDLVRAAGVRYREHLRRMSRTHHKDSRSVTWAFRPACVSRFYAIRRRLEQKETLWFEWAEKELQFAKEMREAFRRAHEQSVEADESDGSKHGREDSP